jgi:hypothetical protein
MERGHHLIGTETLTIRTLFTLHMVYLATYSFNIVHPEDGNFNVHRNTVTASTHDMAKPQKVRVDMQKT